MSIILGVSINFCKLNSMQDEIKIAIDGQQLSRRRIEESFQRMIRYEWNRQDQILSIRSWRNSFVWRKVEERAVKRRDIYSLFGVPPADIVSRFAICSKTWRNFRDDEKFN